MNERDERILRAIMEGMTTGMDYNGKSKTWKRMLDAARLDSMGEEFVARKAARDDENPADAYEAVLWEIEVPAEEYHRAVLDACNEGVKQKPSLNYPKASKDFKTVSGFQIQTNHSVEHLMLEGQKIMIEKVRQMQKSKALRERLAARVMIKLT